ncbi:MAG: flagellar biosynthesis anti-sigma factor FlgM [Candidatus Latescibacterota bacterium]|nr:flagellar biosynthesis anti-sigma factor FlgM [Candidatus Latescibacterota bacterium]
MRIENALNELRGAEVPEKRSEEVRKRRQAPKAGDVVEISKQARTLGSSNITPSDIEAVSDVRQARIDAVRQRVAEGFYDRPEVREAIADAVLDSGLVNDVRDAAHQVSMARQEIKNVPDVRPDRVDQARQRIATGFYDLQATQDEIGRRLSEILIG